MKPTTKAKLPDFMDLTGLDETPLGIFYTDAEPAEGLAPDPLPPPTREREAAGEIDWGAVFGGFSCAIGHIWRARRKGKTAYFSAERFGCPGAAFWLGFMKPQTETIIHYVSTGIPDQMEGECYCESPDVLRQTFEAIDPQPAPARFCVVKPLDQFGPEETPELAAAFGRPEVLSGLHQLAFFVTNDPEVVASPWGAACANLVIWPRNYKAKGRTRAVLGGWDISARKFFRPDELSLSMPFDLFEGMLDRYEESFLTRKNWSTVKKKIAKSRDVWSK